MNLLCGTVNWWHTCSESREFLGGMVAGVWEQPPVGGDPWPGVRELPEHGIVLICEISCPLLPNPRDKMI